MANNPMQDAFAKWKNSVETDVPICTDHYDCGSCAVYSDALAQAAFDAGAASERAASGEPNYRRMTTVLYRSLERLSIVIESCSKIGFEESKPTTNPVHGEIWMALNDAQKDAKLKLKHFHDSLAPHETETP